MFDVNFGNIKEILLLKWLILFMAPLSYHTPEAIMFSTISLNCLPFGELNSVATHATIMCETNYERSWRLLVTVT